MLIRDTTFVVVDTETTGTNAANDRLLEVAAVKVSNGRIIDRYTRLINPQRSVPRRITYLTGITTSMVFDEAPVAEVLPDLLDFMGDGVFVAHNLPFDLGFLNAELRRIGRDPLANDTLCTLRLARRLLRGLRSKSLDSLITFFSLRVEDRHRALGDAQATAEVLLRFIEQVADEHDIDTCDELLHFQHRSYSRIGREPAHLQQIRADVLPHLPDRPGVYFMKDKRDSVIYIGKAKSLRDRVRSYFTGIEAHPERTRKLVQTVRDVAWTETGSELAALLLESRLIKEQQPKFNRAQRRYRNRPFIRLDTTHAAPRIGLSTYLQDDGAEYFGPLPGRRMAELVTEVINQFFRLRECDDATFKMGRQCLYASIGRCTAPCEGNGVAEAYTEEVDRVRDFLLGRDHSILDLLEMRMQAAAAEMAYEQAAEYRDWRQRLEQMLGKQQEVAASVLNHNAVLIQPDKKDGQVQLFLIRFGRHMETVTIAQPPGVDDVARLRERLVVHFDPSLERPARYFKQEVDEVRLLAHWMYLHRDSTRPVHWTPDCNPDGFLEAVLGQLSMDAHTMAGEGEEA